MKKELEQKLYDDFPRIFEKQIEIQCEDGWFNLIHDTCEKLQRERDIVFDAEQPVAIQIKEKFGTLRFYFLGGTVRCLDITQEADNLSSRICEKCGASPAFLTGNHWLRTLCEEHGKDYDR